MDLSSNRLCYSYGFHLATIHYDLWLIENLLGHQSQRHGAKYLDSQQTLGLESYLFLKLFKNIEIINRTYRCGKGHCIYKNISSQPIISSCDYTKFLNELLAGITKI